MDRYHPITRRELIKKLLRLSGCLAFTGVMKWPAKITLSAWAGTKNKGFIIEGIGNEEGYSVKELARKVFEAAGASVDLYQREMWW